MQPNETLKRENLSIIKIARKAYDLGYSYESKYGACSQCAILAIMDAFGDRNDAVFKSAFGFAGGIANLSKMFGALAECVMMIILDHVRDL